MIAILPALVSPAIWLRWGDVKRRKANGVGVRPQ